MSSVLLKCMTEEYKLWALRPESRPASAAAALANGRTGSATSMPDAASAGRCVIRWDCNLQWLRSPNIGGVCPLNNSS